MKDYTKEALNLAARISMELGEDLDVQDFAHAVAFILKSEYGHHNYYNFIQSLNAHFYGN